MQHRFINARINSYTNASTSCESLVKIGSVTSEFKREKIENVPRLGSNLTIIVDPARWHSEANLEYHNFDFRRLIGNHFCTSCENLVRLD